MFKRCILVTALIMMYVLPVSAHSVLVSSNPEDGETINGEVKEITLTFNTKVEKGSSFTLVDQANNEYKPDSIDIKDKIITGKFNEALPTETYKLNWQIIGSDGHAIEGSYSFNVNNEQKNEEEFGESNSVGDQPTENADQNESKDTSDNNNSTKNDNSTVTQDDTNEQNITMPIVVLVLSVIVLVFLIIRIQKVKKK